MMIKHFGLDPDKDVKLSPAGSGEGRLIRMQQGLLDATVATVPTDYHGGRWAIRSLSDRKTSLPTPSAV